MPRLLARWVFAITLVICPVWTALCATARPAWYPPDDAVQKQLALREQRRAASEAYYVRVIRGQYDKVGIRSPRWDEAMYRVIATNIAQRLDESNQPPDAQMERVMAVNKCGVQLCTDPLFRYMHARTGATVGAPPEMVKPLTIAGCTAMLGSEYQGILRFYASLNLAIAVGEGRPDGADTDLTKAERHLDAAMKVLPTILAEPDLPDCEISNLLLAAGEASARIYHDRWKWTQGVYAQMEKTLPGRSALLAAKGNLFVTYAWDARGSGWAYTVTEDGRRLMKERLETAESACTKAWEMDNQCLQAAVEMIRVTLGQGKGEPVMEKWFRRAVAIDPKHMAAYTAKLLYLAAKWHGSDEQQLAFAREVAATLPATWRARLIVIDAHLDKTMTAGKTVFECHEAYFREHPEAWQESLGILNDVLSAKDASKWDHLNCARLAACAGDVETGRKMLKAVSTEEAIMSSEGYQELRDMLGADQ